MISPLDHLSDETLNEWLDQALEARARAAVEAHLAACSDCTARAGALRSLFAQLESLPDVWLERDLSPSVVTAIRRPASAPVTARAPWLAGLVFAAQAAAAVLLLAFAWPLAAVFTDQLSIPVATPALTPLLGELGGLFAGLRTFAANPLGLLQTAQHWLAAAPAAVASLLPAWVHPLEAALVVAAAAGLWLLGNAFILTPPLLARLRRHS